MSRITCCGEADKLEAVFAFNTKMRNHRNAGFQAIHNKTKNTGL